MTADKLASQQGGAEEDRLRQLYAEVLSMDSVGMDDSFFALEGDSIAVLRLVSRARQEGLELGIQDVFDAKTVRALAAIVRARAASAGESRRAQVASAGPVDGLEALSEQELDDIAAEMRR
ncbi:phosphopantetheine-binding protein [Streptomyces sp. NPDC017248]|uniref:phosphopantetheine-binding protein n=1 Tax=unclassified Streptomyces TaxID=2593676 RepID=UPI00378CC2B1